MRHLAAMTVIQELDVDRYQLTNFSRSLTAPPYAAGYPCMWVTRYLQPRRPSEN